MGRFDSLAGQFRETQDANTDGAGSSPDTNTDQDGSKATDQNAGGEGNQDAGTQKGEEGKKQEPKKDQQVPFHKHPRFIDLNTKYTKTKTELETANNRIKELEAQVAGNGGGGQKKPEDMSMEEYNEWILSEAKRVAQEAIGGDKEKKEEKKEEGNFDQLLAQIDSEFTTIRDFDSTFSVQDEEAVIELCMNPPEELQKTLGDRKNPTIREAYKFYKKKSSDKVSEEKRKQAEVRSGGTTNGGTDGEYSFQTMDDIKKAGQRMLGTR